MADALHYPRYMKTEYKVVKLTASRFEVTNLVTGEAHSVWGDLITARKVAATLSARKG